MRRILLLLSLVLFTAGTILAQRTVTGTVVDENNQPLIGASVLVKGTATGAITDLDGNFSVDVPEGSNILVVSYTGFQTQEIELGASNVMDVTLRADTEIIDEVVVTALGVSRERKTLGYAVQEVNADEFNKAQQSDVISSLAGRLSGVEMRQSSNLGGSKRITIRGANSFFGENQPLIVVDGLPVDNSNYNTTATQGGSGGVDYGNMLNDLNPEDIDNISVLKGPAAALYGSRASNGVIVITTKKAKIGGDQAFKVDYSSSVNFESAYKMPEIQYKYGGGAVISDEDGGQDGFLVANIEGQDYRIVQYGIDESWGPRFNSDISVLHWDAFDEESYPEDYLRPRPWVAPSAKVPDFFETGDTYTNSIGISKSGTDYGVRFGFTNSTGNGIIPGSELDKNVFSLIGNANLWKGFTLDMNLNYIRSETKGRPVLGYPASGQRYGNTFGQTLYQWFQTNVDFDRQKNYKNLDGSQRSWNRNYWYDATPHYSDNYYWIAYENFNDDERDRLYGNIALSYELMDGLTVTGRASRDNFAFYNRERVAVGSQAQSSYYEAVRNNYEDNFELSLSYNANLSESLSLDVMAGGNQMRRRYHFNRGETSGGLVVANLYNLLNSGGTVLTNDLSEIKKVNSVFGRAAIGFANMVYLDLTARNDWSSALPDDNNSYFYPSASLSWVFSELFDQSWLNYGKIRAGWASIANDTDPYKVLSTYSFNSDGTFQGVPRIFTPNDLLNANLEPETTTSIEFGLEASILRNRVGFDVTYFDNTTEDQIIPLELSKSTGYDSKFINAGEINNSGVEASINVVPVQTRDVEWTIGVNYTKINSEVVEITEGIDAMDLVRAPFGGVFLRASVGDVYGQLWGTDFVYDDAGNRVIDENGYWAVTPNLVPLGSVTPDFNMGITNRVSYKNFDLSFLIDIQKGGKFYSVSHMWGHYAGTWEATAGVNDKGNEIRDPVSDGGGIRLEGVTGDVEFNEDGTYSVTNTAENQTYVSGQGWAARHYHGFGFPSAQSVFDADYVKVREATLSYTFDIRSEFVKSLTVTAYGRNFLTMGLDYDGLDPEVTVNGSGNIQGIEGGMLPTTRSFGLKVQLGL